MKPLSEIVEELSNLSPAIQILTEIEDRYVYSFESIYSKPIHPIFDIIVRDNESEISSNLLNWGKGRDVTITRMKSIKPTKQSKTSRFSILLDDTPIPEIQVKSKKIRGIKELIGDKISRHPYRIQNNIISAVQTLFSRTNLTRCLQKDISGSYCTVTRSYGGVETWSAKGRMILIKGLLKGELDLSNKVVDILYTCSECGNCFSDCFEQSDFYKAILKMRNIVSEKNRTPQIFSTTSINIAETGDPAATPSKKRFAWLNNMAKKSVPEQPDILYWAGCMVANRTPRAAIAFYNILKAVGANFTILGKDEGCCGYVLFSSGLWNEAKIIAKEVFQKIENTGVETVITPCAGCFYTFTKLFPEISDLDLPCKVLHSTQFIENEIKTKKISFNALDTEITYHDPCSLGRHCGVYDAPRVILKSIPDLKLNELTFNKAKARCCGGGGGLWNYSYQISMDCAANRLSDDFVPLNTDLLATTCPLCQTNFRLTAKRRSIPLKVFDITEIVNSTMKMSPVSI